MTAIVSASPLVQEHAEPDAPLSYPRMRVFNDVYCVETPAGVRVQGSIGGFDVEGRGSYSLVSWLLRAFDKTAYPPTVLERFPEKLRDQANFLLESMIQHRLARSFRHADDECDEDIRRRFPELSDTVEALAESPRDAWRNIQLAHVYILAVDDTGQQIHDALHAYDLESTVFVANAADDFETQSRIENAWSSGSPILIDCGIAISVGRLAQILQGCLAEQTGAVLFRTGGGLYVLDFCALSGVALSSTLLHPIAGHFEGKDTVPPLSPVARAMAVQTACVHTFKHLALSPMPSVPSVLSRVDEATLVITRHIIVPAPHRVRPAAQWSRYRAAAMRPRASYGASLGDDAGFERLNAIAADAARLVDVRFGPVISLEDVAIDRSPVPTALLCVRRPRNTAVGKFLIPALSARECLNQGVLVALDCQCDGANFTSGNDEWIFAFGWNEQEAAIRALKKLVILNDKQATSVLSAPSTILATPEIEAMHQAVPFSVDDIRLRAAPFGWRACSLAQDRYIAPSSLGVGPTDEHALLDLLLHRSAHVTSLAADGTSVVPAWVNPTGISTTTASWKTAWAAHDARVLSMSELLPRQESLHGLHVAALRRTGVA